MSNFSFTEKAFQQYIYLQTQDKKTLKRINSLLTDISRNGYNGFAKSEPLKGNLSGFWSKRIDDKNRIVFRIVGDVIEIIQCYGHYDF